MTGPVPEISLRDVPARPTAVIARATTWAQFPALETAVSYLIRPA